MSNHNFTLETKSGHQWRIQLTERAAGLEIVVNGKTFHYPSSTKGFENSLEQAASGQAGIGSTEGLVTVVAPMPGVILRIAVESGQSVRVEDTLLILSAMKMENEIVASQAGRIDRVLVAANESVQAGQPLVVIRGDAEG